MKGRGIKGGKKEPPAGKEEDNPTESLEILDNSAVGKEIEAEKRDEGKEKEKEGDDSSVDSSEANEGDGSDGEEESTDEEDREYEI